MRLWNLSEFSSFDGSEILSRSAVVSKKRRSGVTSAWRARFQVLIGAGALAGSFSIGMVNAQATTIHVRVPIAGIIQNIPETAPPLARHFKDSFQSDGWSKMLEDELLGRVEAKRAKKGNVASDSEEAVETVVSNQKENLDDSDRLSRSDVIAVLKGRKRAR